MSATFYVHNLGCKVNRVESDSITARLIENGAHAVSRALAAVIIINTCTVTAEADTKTRKAIRQAHGAKQEPWVVVTGCSAALHAEELSSLGKRVIVEPDRQAALECALALCHPEPPPPRHHREHSTRTGALFNTRVGIKIQDGCNNRCSFCIVSTARGPAHSTAAQEIFAELERHAAAGTREFILTGVNLGSYRDGSYDLVALLQEALGRTSQVRFRLSSIEPLDVTETLLQTMAQAQGRICAHLHMPLQSGSDRILQRMRRPYSTHRYEEIVRQAKSLLPHLALTTDVIVGFPGETDDDFEETCSFCERMAFSGMHIFRYSKRPRTEAAEMPDQLSPTLKKERSKTLSDLASLLTQNDSARRVNTTEYVLIEQPGKGTSESYHPVSCASSSCPGELLPITFSSYEGALLFD